MSLTQFHDRTGSRLKGNVIQSAPRWLAALAVSATLFAAPRTFASLGCVSDVDNDHMTDVNDLLAVLDNWGSCPPAPGLCPSDILPNGTVNVSDLLEVINAWGNCPCLPQFGCVTASTVWCENFELGNYSRWTGGYDSSGPCRTSGFATDRFVSPTKSHKSQVTCAMSESHRGYGGLRFQGDNCLSSFTSPSSGGINAPNGVIVSFWIWLKVPYDFSPTKWLSLGTVTNDCSNNWTDVITLNLDDPTRRLKPVHVSSVTYAPGAPSVPLQQWVKITWYINYSTGTLHAWQNGQKVVSATFSRPVHTLCQWHWGLYASGNNNDITLYEEDIRILKLSQPLTNFTVEPWFPGVSIGCP